MKKSGIIAAASAAAASATVISSSSPSSSTHVPKSERSCDNAVSNKSRENHTAASEKFAPRFDGLRFIETLVTAHR